MGEALVRKARHMPRHDSGLGATAAHPERDEALPHEWRVRSSPHGIDPSTVLQEVVIEGVGRFRYFGDGRVSTIFADRTVLTMRPAPPLSGAAAPSVGPAWMLCEVVHPDGRTTTVRSSFPIGAEGYVQLAMQFQKWAAMSPDERVGAAERRSCEDDRIRAELDRINRHLVSSGGQPCQLTDAAPSDVGLSATSTQSTSVRGMWAAQSGSEKTVTYAPLPALDAAKPLPSRGVTGHFGGAEQPDSVDGITHATVMEELRRLEAALQPACVV